MSSITGLIQQIIRNELRKIKINELGIVTSVFPHSDDGDKDNYECNVQLKNNGLELRKVPIATQHIGTVGVPNVGDLVMVSFIKGDVNAPIITGRLYNDEDRPPLNNPNEVIFRIPLHAEDQSALKLEARNIEENTPPRELLIQLLDKVTIKVVDDEVHAEAGTTKVTLSQKGDNDGVVTVEAGKSKITVNQDGDILVESEGAMNLKSTGDMSLNAPNINLKSDQAIGIEAGTEGTFKTGTTAKIEASATLDIKGAMVNIN
jgi:uncharacterized protein involved in type VI secretion and phage assembly